MTPATHMFAALFAPLFLLAACAPIGPVTAKEMPGPVTLPPGFQIETIARVPAARSLLVMEDWGVILVGTRGSTIYAIIDEDRDGKTDKVEVAVQYLNGANGIAWKGGYLYVGEQNQIVRYAAPDLKTLQKAKPELLFDKLPDNSWHGWRYNRFGPDGKLYVAVGSPCNVCRTFGLQGTIIRLNTDGSGLEIFASGVRNSVGFDFQPATGHLYFTDNGADQMGDDSPPDELNLADRKGLWFGFPFYGGDRDRTPDFSSKKILKKATFPVINFGAHVAALGVSFYSGRQFPSAYRGDAFVAQHGSWNRSVPDGYRVMRIRFDKKTHKAVSKEVFASGFMRPNFSVWGRPVDVKQTRDGSLLVSDDKAGAVYRITYKN